jgi:hypothetical protein
LPELEHRCNIVGLGSFSLDFEVSCNMLQEEADLAFEILDERLLVPYRDQHVFDGVQVRVHASDCVYSGGECKSGIYSWWMAPHVELKFHRRSILHELLHHWDSIHFAFGTSWHQHWDTNGYNASEAEYVPRLSLIWRRWGYDPLSGRPGVDAAPLR